MSKFIIRDKDVMGRCIAEIMTIKTDASYTVEIKENKTTRSINQNSLYWKWLGIISKDIGMDSQELHEDILEYGWEFIHKDDEDDSWKNNKRKDIKGNVREKRKSSTELTTKQFSNLMLCVEQLARRNDIKLPTKEYYGYE